MTPMLFALGLLATGAQLVAPPDKAATAAPVAGWDEPEPIPADPIPTPSADEPGCHIAPQVGVALPSFHVARRARA
jgi:hypothetical protein